MNNSVINSINNSANKLKPCPFCGGEARAFGEFWFTYVKCKECGAQIKSANNETARKFWNNRAETEEML